MRPGRFILFALVTTFAVWAVFTWPLPRHLSSAIPSSSQNVEKGQLREMIPGDPLQLRYHFWLFADWLGGGTPWFHNLYEFNTGDDAATREPSAGYLPFSAVYALGHAVAGPAFGYNAALLFSLFLAFVFLWALARRYAPDPAVALAASLAGLLLPYRWASLLGGSPSGFGLAWIPLVILGLDIAARDGRWTGGLWAGLGALMLSLSDTQGFFFALLFAPAWCAIAFLPGELFRRPSWRRWAGRAAALLPFAALAVIGILYNRFWHRGLGESAIAGGRALAEVAGFSPAPRGLVVALLEGRDSHVYLGLPLLVLVGAGVAVALARARRGDADLRRRAAALALVAVAFAGIVVLALGPRGPFEGLAFRAARKLVPPYAMLRQPQKVFALMPAVSCAAVALALRAGRRPVTAAGPLMVAFLLAVDYRVQVRPTLCGLRDRQDAYAAVARDAAAAGLPPRALVLPLWPGDSDYGSIYEHYASLHRVRMVNGYRPAVPAAYVRDVFSRYEGLNQGAFDDELIDDLRARGIRWAIVHEDLYPEKVSPFPVGALLRRLLAHPRLTRLAQDESVWAFRLEPRDPAAAGPSVAAAEAAAAAGLLPPAWHWEAERENRADADASRDGDGTGYVRLERPGQAVAPRRPGGVARVAGLRWMIRARGAGTVSVETAIDGAASAAPLAVASTNWAWLAAPFEMPAPFARVRPRIAAVSGAVDVDRFHLAAGPPPPAPGREPADYPAAALFRAGCTAADGASVVLRAAADPLWVVFYGPKWPMEPGAYELRLEFESDAPPGTPLGRINVRRRMEDPLDWTPVAAGAEARARFALTESLPVSFEFLFLRNADVTLHRVRVRRID